MESGRWDGTSLIEGDWMLELQLGLVIEGGGELKGVGVEVILRGQRRVSVVELGVEEICV